MSAPGLPAEDLARLDRLYERIAERAGHCLGYPSNQSIDYSLLFRFLAHPLNNLGDPFGPSTYEVNTHDIEREVLAFFAEITRAPADGYWGYVTSGGTEGNMYGLYLARELLPDGMVYFSEETHYSVGKSLRVLGMRHIMIKSRPGGEMDLDDLQETLRIHRDLPPILFVNVGTTMKEAVDDLPRIREMLESFAVARSYVHVDAALSGMTLPFVPGAPPFDFAAGADSLSISGHKFIGSPFPCGVVLARRPNVDRIARSVEYTGALDTTLSGSRSGLAALILWTAIRRHGREGFRRIVEGCLETAAYAVRKLREAGVEAWRHDHALTVVFPKPAPPVVRKWQLATAEGIAHLIAMPHVTREQVDGLVADIRAGGGPA